MAKQKAYKGPMEPMEPGRTNPFNEDARVVAAEMTGWNNALKRVLKMLPVPDGELAARIKRLTWKPGQGRPE